MQKPKGECHLCAYSDLGQKLKDGQKASGKDGAANNSKSGGGGGGQTKREKLLEKEVQDLKKQLGQSKPDADGGADADATAGDVDVKELRASLARTKTFFDDYRSIYMEDVSPEALAANTDEFEKSSYVAELRAKIATREQALTDATPTGQRAQQLDKEIKNAEAAV